MAQISLANDMWEFDPDDQLGPAGGFGAVFRGRGSLGTVAVKRLHLRIGDAASREVKIGQVLCSRQFDYVVPILDYGFDHSTGTYFIVMPICGESLQRHVERNGPLAADEAIDVALNILAGLREVSEIVHRDLKPANVLRLNDRWCLADFGIAKLIEDSTSLNTLRDCLTPDYGAPEQWRAEASTHATDVYALGCIWHTLLTGSPPFAGTLSRREAHLSERPPDITGVGDQLSALISRMLRKAPEARPTIPHSIEVLAALKKKRRH